MVASEFWVMWLTAVFATYFVSVNLAHMDGPFDVFLRLRDWMGAYTYGANGQPLERLGRMAICPYCWGAWVAMVVTPLAFGLSWHLPIYWLAVSGGHYFLLKVGG